MTSYKAFFFIFILLVAIDYLWTGLIAKKFYVEHLGSLARTLNGSFSVNVWSAVAVYVVLAFGIVYFVLPRLLAMPSTVAFLPGALFGLVVYACYDFTNYAILQSYPFTLCLVDILWGTVLCGIVTQIVVMMF
jgi:uncharacterized membrane protein